MTFVWFVAIAIGMAGVFALFWWLVELTGGIAGGALSVSRSVRAGFVTWLESPGDITVEPTPVIDDDPAPVAIDAGFEVPTERVRPEDRR
jgi:hypothetical protein